MQRLKIQRVRLTVRLLWWMVFRIEMAREVEEEDIDLK